ncbi:E3 ubiquitin-protein ligase RNF135 [Rana temporaria]|uniref:E3 ubiquitin-protein ligase RNF135 n=1 Tax=Rana temporaria TaxID=8407 RepID=UPI001AAC9E41|nr:E3 ubiquitin-protein ligase RNF135 [Rana temporaria]
MEESAVSVRVSVGEVQCTVCMGVFRVPCTLPCGHTCCLSCIERWWGTKPNNCPLCQTTFPSPPQLSKNIVLSGLLEALQAQDPRGPHDTCPQCTGPGATALCLPCMVPLCGEHRILHPASSSQRHLLVTPSTAPWACRGHPRGLQYFCVEHGAALCPECELQHPACRRESLLERYRRNRERLEKRISDLEEKIGSKEAMITNQKDGYREAQILICDIKDSLTRDFREMRDYLEKQERASFWRMQEEKDAAQRATSQEVQIFMAEIDRMRKEKAELQECIENDWMGVLKHSGWEGSGTPSSSSPKKRYAFDENRLVDTTDAISRMKKSLMSHPLLEQVPCPPKQVFEESPISQTSPGGVQTPITELPEKSPNNLLQWATRLSFDPQTVNSRLALSEDLKTVKVTTKNVVYEKSDRRFVTSQVLCSPGFSSGCHYWELSMKDSGGWGVGAAAAGMGRDGKLGRNHLSWCVEWSKDQLSVWHNNQDLPVALPRPINVGVLLDCQEKELKFYSVSEEKQILIHCYRIQIQSRIFPAVWLYGLKAGNSLTIRDLQSTGM